MDRLLEALLLSEPQARQAWEQWRATQDINTISYASQQLFPALSPAFPNWLEHDPAAAIFKGIIRQFWSQNQLRLQKAEELDILFTQVGVRSVIVGPVAWALRTPAPAIRAIPHLTFLVPRGQVRDAMKVLMNAGWALRSNLPGDQAWDWGDHVSFQRENLWLHLHWRLIAVPPEDACECEQVFLSQIGPIEWNAHTLWTTLPEATLLHILCAPRQGDLPWQADVALLGTAGIQWMSFLELARRFTPLATERLRELHPYPRLAIPPLPSNDLDWLHRKFRHIGKAYRTNSYYRKRSSNRLGFVEFLTMAFAKKCVRALAKLRRKFASA